MRSGAKIKMVRLVGLEPTTGKTPVDFKPTAYANFATAAPATRHRENITPAIGRNARRAIRQAEAASQLPKVDPFPGQFDTTFKFHTSITASGLKMPSRLAEEFRVVQ
jgi:hypothetical protein